MIVNYKFSLVLSKNIAIFLLFKDKLECSQYLFSDSQTFLYNNTLKN